MIVNGPVQIVHHLHRPNVKMLKLCSIEDVNQSNKLEMFEVDISGSEMPSND